MKIIKHLKYITPYLTNLYSVNDPFLQSYLNDNGGGITPFNKKKTPAKPDTGLGKA